MKALDSKEDSMKTVFNIAYTDSNSYQQMLDVYLPEKSRFPVFVFFHGGGIEGGSKEGFLFIPELVEKGVAVVCANYRLYPQASFPDFLCDAAAAVAWAKDHMGAYGEVTGLFMGGTSAGGYLTQMLCFDGRYLAYHGIDADSIDGYFMDAGQPTAHYNVLRERGLDTRRVIVDETAPLYFVGGERKYPPMKILVSDRDVPNRLEQTVLLVSTLRSFGQDMERVELEIVPNSTHTQYVQTLQDGRSVYAAMILDFLQKYGKPEGGDRK